MRKGRGRVYRVYKKRSLQDEGYVECQFCGSLVHWDYIRFSAFGGEEMCPSCKRREEERMRAGRRSHA